MFNNCHWLLKMTQPSLTCTELSKPFLERSLKTNGNILMKQLHDGSCSRLSFDL